MRTISITTKRKDHCYDIIIETGIFSQWQEEVKKRVSANRFIVLADQNVAALRGLEKELAGQSGWDMLLVEPGETRKNLQQYSELCEKSLSLGIDRKSVVVALGGGVIGDIAGYVAATLLRGIRFIQIPTTLLAQVDSSVGGKTGVNAAAGKNLVGAFHQPELVLIDPALLDTLPTREYLAGLAEVVKCAILTDRVFFDQLTALSSQITARNHDVLSTIIEFCCRIKADIVSADETEKGKRALLNLGHTFGHALEALAGYDGRVVHGEAVAVGTVLAAAYSVKMGLLQPGEAKAIQACFIKLGLPVRISSLGQGDSATPSTLDWQKLMNSPLLSAALLQDKKADTRQLTLILPTALGCCDIVKGVGVEKVADFMRENLAEEVKA